ncbi:MAG: 5'/3'-nucleotidase SurE [Planctomycetaceae bacterium]
MKFLITNDDGYAGPGLAALYQALKPLGDVRVVAPLTCHSAKGHAVNTHSPLRVERREVAPFGLIDIVDASPADCVRVGLRAPGAETPDFVVAGINTGANLGVDLFYSGTAAAAREAAILGVPSLALSRYMREDFPVNWDILAKRATSIINELIHEPHRLPVGQFWNVNFPAVANEAYPQEMTITYQNLMAHDIRFQHHQPESPPEDHGPNVTWLEYTGEYRQRGQSDGCDVSLLFGNRITATPIDLCTTAQHPTVRRPQ